MRITNEKVTNKSQFLSKKNIITYSNFLIFIFFILSFIGILNHEMWRDETQAWLIARDASTLVDLYHNLKYEGHPGLWHFCLFLITKLTHNPFAMQLFHILIATSIVCLFVKFSPFNILEKTLFTFSYFPFFEYNIISRNYNLGLLLIFIFCYLFTRENRNNIGLFFTLALLANTNIYGFIICLCLSASLIIDSIRRYKKHQYRLKRKQVRSLIIGLLLLFLGISLSIFQLLPAAILDTAKDIQQNIGQETVISKFDLFLNMFRRFTYSVRTIFYSYIPIPNIFEYHFWSENFTTVSSTMGLLAFLISLFLLTFSIFIFIEKPIVLFLFLSGTLTIFLFTWLKWIGSLRHHGNLFVLFLACIWISKFYRNSYNIPKKLQYKAQIFKKYQKQIITIILCIQMLSGLYAYSMDLIYPFSQSRAAAQFIQKQGLSQDFILGNRDTIVSPIAAYIDREIYYIEYNRIGSFFNNNKDRKYLDNQWELIEKIYDAIQGESRKNILILSYPLKVTSSKLKITPIKEFSNSIVSEERYFIYLVEMNGSANIGI